MGWPFVIIGFLGRLPVAMIVVGVLTMVTAVRGSLAEAGIASAAVGLAAGVGGPLVGAAADRWGQRWVLTVVALINSAALLAMVVAVNSPVPIGVVMIFSALTGLASPQLAPMARARWIGMLSRHSDATPVHTNSAMAYESTAEEVTFILGPVVVGLLASLISPVAPIIGAVVITLVFVIAFAWHDSAKHAVARSGTDAAPAPLRDLLRARLLVPLAGMLTIGYMFGTILTSLTGFMDSIDLETSTGLVYGAMSVTSAVTSLLAGLLPGRFALRWRWMLAVAIALVAAFAFPAVSSIPSAIIVLLFLGLGIGPAMVTIFSIAAEVAPFGRLTTVMTLFGSSIIVGQSLGTATISQLVTLSGYQAGFVAITATVGVLCALAAVNVVLARPGRASRV